AADLVALARGRVGVHLSTVCGDDDAVNPFSRLAAYPAATEIFQHGLGCAIQRIAEAAPARDLVDEQAALRQRDALRHALPAARLAPFAAAHRRRVRIFSLLHFMAHVDAG